MDFCALLEEPVYWSFLPFGLMLHALKVYPVCEYDQRGKKSARRVIGHVYFIFTDIDLHLRFK